MHVSPGDTANTQFGAIVTNKSVYICLYVYVYSFTVVMHVNPNGMANTQFGAMVANTACVFMCVYLSMEAPSSPTYTHIQTH